KGDNSHSPQPPDAHRRHARLRGVGRVPHYLLQHFQVVEISLPSFGSDPADGLRAVVIVAFLDLDESGLAERVKMSAQIAVGEPAHLLQIAEDQALRVGHERCEHAQARLLVDHAVEPFVSEAPFLGVFWATLWHRSPRWSGREWQP